MNFSDDYFEALKFRYTNRLRISRQEFLKKSRNESVADEVYKAGFQLTSQMKLDEFSERVSVYFNFQYDLGVSIEEILDQLTGEVRTRYLEEYSKREHFRTVAVKRKLFGIPMPFKKYYETFNHNGELTERYKVKLDWNKENVKKFKEAKSIDEKALIYSLLVIQREYLYQKPIEFSSKIIDAEETDRNRWFKALVKHRAEKEFSPELYTMALKPEEQKAVSEIREKRKKESPRLIKWTDGRNKNNFVKLVYALHNGDFIDNGSGEVTKAVENLAPVFGIELGDWESNFSKGILNQGHSYDHATFFEDLKKSYLEIVDDRTKNQQLKKKIRKQLEKEVSDNKD